MASPLGIHLPDDWEEILNEAAKQLNDVFVHTSEDLADLSDSKL